MNIQISLNADIILEKLKNAGFRAYIVGGCVRDMLIGREPFDWDICTSALPEEIKKVFNEYKILENNTKYGTVTVIAGGEHYEVTTFRCDGEYGDGRRPEKVTFVKSLREDLSRRDFTVNAIAYNRSEGVQDFFGGISDISRKIIKCIGDPDKRFSEDALRILRALRFSATLGFEIEKGTSQSVYENKELLRHVSKERRASEFFKLICGENAANVLREYSSVIGVFIPEIMPMIGCLQRNVHHKFDVWEHTLVALEHTENDKILRLAAFFHDIGKPSAFSVDDSGVGHFYGHSVKGEKLTEKILRELKADNQTIKDVTTLVKYHDILIESNSVYVKRWLNRIGPLQFDRLLKLKYADAMGQSDYCRNEKLQILERLRKIFEKILEEEQCFNLKSLAINGNDVMKCGFRGEKVGEILGIMLNKVITGEMPNQREILIKNINKMLK